MGPPEPKLLVLLLLLSGKTPSIIQSPSLDYEVEGVCIYHYSETLDVSFYQKKKIILNMIIFIG